MIVLTASAAQAQTAPTIAESADFLAQHVQSFCDDHPEQCEELRGAVLAGAGAPRPPLGISILGYLAIAVVVVLTIRALRAPAVAPSPED